MAGTQGNPTIQGYRRPLGYQQIAVSTAVNLTLPPAPAVPPAAPIAGSYPPGQPPALAVITCNGGTVRWRDDGTAPTSSTGQAMFSGSAPLQYSGDLTVIQFIAATGTPILDVTYYA